MCDMRVVMLGVLRQSRQSHELRAPTMARSVKPQRLLYTDAVFGICAAGTDGGIHGGEEEMVDKGSAPLDDDATHVEEEGATVHAGHNAPSVRDGETEGHVEEEGATVDMSLAIIVRPPSVRDVETGGHVDC
ncbi:hypothetical protein CBR_g45883 [Chara braunii]|uniref:Uncharacterized protein n=1 Tax=Chara braunii TaxID=69332 RepID=A0A388LZT8_CHABU|nr:hypothetical protein CBR_g45883 [Chara braunii]|eukprot:GBG87729.1 hypothetical protein CBR_g45883 [Chara braunii]